MEVRIKISMGDKVEMRRKGNQDGGEKRDGGKDAIRVRGKWDDRLS